MTSTAPAPAATTRVPLWDNARFLAVTLMVIGHGVQRMTGDSDNAYIVYLFIYGFHVPAFAIISGYFSRSTPPGTKQMTKVLTDLVVPYVIMEAIWSLIQFLVDGKDGFNPTKPSWTLWFLLALAIFRLLLPYLALLRWPLLWALVFSVGVGYLSNVDSTFSLSRAIGLLPFFVLGWKLRDWGLVELWHRATGTATWLVRAAAAVVLAGWAAVLVVFLPQFREISLQHWLFYDDSYSAIGATEWWAGAARLGFIALATLLSAAFLALIPRTDTWITGFGQATMYIYLLHSFVLYPIRESGVLQGHTDDGWLVSMVLAGIGISLALASPPIRWLFRPLIEPRATWLLSESARASAK